MNIIETVILGIVEGLTEFLPISSTGHLILVGHWLGTQDEVAASFEIFIQLGAIMAVVVLYRERFAMLFQKGGENSFSGLRGWLLLAVTCFPAALLGLLLHGFIKTHLFSPTTVMFALGVGGVILILVERIKFTQHLESLDQLTFKQALWIGLFQSFALWPGVSRSAATIIGGLVSGFERKAAAEYSFIAAVPLMFMATGYDLLKSYKFLSTSDLGYFTLGFLIAFASAIVAIKFFIHMLQRYTLAPFGVYRIVLALLLLWVLR